MAHWLDSDVLINAMNDAYGFDIAPGFWEFLQEGFINHRFFLADAVAREIYQRDDELAAWVHSLPEGAIVIQSESVQAEYRPIADHVHNGGYPNRKKFLTEADGWLIAHAKVDGGIVVSQETSAGTGQEAKVPDIGLRFGVKVIPRGQLLRDCGVRLVRA